MDLSSCWKTSLTSLAIFLPLLVDKNFLSRASMSFISLEFPNLLSDDSRFLTGLEFSILSQTCSTSFHSFLITLRLALLIEILIRSSSSSDESESESAFLPPFLAAAFLAAAAFLSAAALSAAFLPSAAFYSAPFLAAAALSAAALSAAAFSSAAAFFSAYLSTLVFLDSANEKSSSSSSESSDIESDSLSQSEILNFLGRSEIYTFSLSITDFNRASQSLL